MYGGCREQRTAYGPRLLPECTSTNERISPNIPQFVAMLTVSLQTRTFALDEAWLHRNSSGRLLPHLRPLFFFFFLNNSAIHANGDHLCRCYFIIPFLALRYHLTRETCFHSFMASLKGGLLKTPFQNLGVAILGVRWLNGSTYLRQICRLRFVPRDLQ